MFKEVVFELAGGECRSRHAAHFFNRPGLSARMQILHATTDAAWELVEATGEAEAVAELRRALEAGPEPPMRGLEVVSATPKGVQYVVNWGRSGPEDPCATTMFLLYDIVGPEAIFAMRIENARAEVKVAGPDGERLLRFFNEMRHRMEPEFRVRLTRVGELRPGWEPAREARASHAFREEDRQLVAFALAAGYYDNPKKCGVREPVSYTHLTLPTNREV